MRRTKQSLPQPAQPNNTHLTDWYFNGDWRISYPSDDREAKRLRKVLRYPARELGPAENGRQIANQTAALHRIIDELDPTDREALYEAARLLLVVPRPAGIVKPIS